MLSTRHIGVVLFDRLGHRSHKYGTISTESSVDVRARPLRRPTQNPNHLRQAREFFDTISVKLGHGSKSDWYLERNLKGIIASHGGGGFLAQRFCNSPVMALKAAYPEHEFLEWRFQTVPRRFWSEISNHRRFLDWCAHQLGFDPRKDWQMWYKVHRDEVFSLGGSTLLVHYYRSSLSNAIMLNYSEFSWDSTQFLAVSQKHWAEDANVREFFDNAGKRFGVQSLEDWYSFGTVENISKAGGSGMLQSRFDGSVLRALETAYPNHRWQAWSFNRAAKGETAVASKQPADQQTVLE